MSTQISAQPCQSYVLSLGQPVRDCAGPMGKVRVPVFVTWSSQAEINCFDLDIQVLFQFNTGNFEFSMFETKASLSPILMNSSSWFQFELINNSSSTQTFRMSGIPSTPQAPNPHLPRIQFPHTPLDAIHLLDLVYSNNEKTGIDILEQQSQFCIFNWNFPICGPIDCRTSALAPGIEFDNALPDPNKITVDGYIFRKPGLFNNGLPNVKVIFGAGTLQETRRTDIFGHWCIDIPKDKTTIGATKIGIAVSREINPACGVTAADMSEIRKHILGISSSNVDWNNPASLMSADINNSGAVTTADITCIQKFILGIPLGEGPCGSINKSWAFVPESKFNLTEAIPGEFPREIEELFYPTGNYTFQRTYGAKLGDVNRTCDHLVFSNFGNTEIQSRTALNNYPFLIAEGQTNPLNPSEKRFAVHASDLSVLSLFGGGFHIPDHQILRLDGAALLLNDYFDYKLNSTTGGIDLFWVSASDIGQAVDPSQILFYIVTNNVINAPFSLPVIDAYSITENGVMKSDGSEYNLSFGVWNSNTPLSLTNKRISVFPNPVKDHSVVSAFHFS